MEFKYDVRDLKFILKEWLPTDEVTACDRFKETFSVDDVDMLLTEGYKVAREIINPINAPGDKIGVKFENGQSIPPPGFKEAYQFLQQNGWGTSSECIMVETGMPLIIYKAIFEMNTAACTSLMSAIKLTSGVSNLLLRFGRAKGQVPLPSQVVLRRMAGNHVHHRAELRLRRRRHDFQILSYG